MSIESNNNFESKSLRELESEKILAETKQNKEALKESISKSIITRLTSKDGYKAISHDELGLINKITSKGNHIRFFNEGDNIWPNDIINIELGKVYRTNNGKKEIVGVVTEGFKKIEITNPEVLDKTNPEVLNKTNPEILDKTNPEILDKTNPEILDKTNPEVLDKTNPKKIENVENKWQTVAYSKNGANYIIGKNGEPKLMTTKELTPEFKKGLEKYKDALILSENFNLLLSALTQSGKDVSKETLKIQTSINSFNPSEAGKGSENIQRTITETFYSLNIDNRNDIKLSDRISVLNYIRDELDNYELVRKNIVEKEFNSLTKISDVELEKFIENPTSNQDKIKKILGEKDFKKFQEDIIDKISEAKKYFVNNQAALQKQFPGVKIENIKGLVVDSFVGTFAKIEISENFIEKNQSTYMKGYNGTNKELAIFSDIQGIGALNVSDRNSNIGYEGFKLIATEIAAIAAGMLTMGVGAYAVNAAVYGNRLFKGIQYLQSAGKLANTTIKGAKLTEQGTILAAKTGRFAAMSAVEGGAFYAGYGAVQSGIEGKNAYSMEGLKESIIYMGAFKGLNGVYKLLGKEIQAGVPLTQQKLRIGSQFLAEGALLAGLGLESKGILSEPGEWTADTILQAFAMALGFKAMGIKMDRMKFKQTKDGRVEAETPKGAEEGNIYSKIKEKYENSNLSFINREFDSIFKKHDFEKGGFRVKDKSGKEISITKEGKFYKVNGTELNYSKKQLFEEIINKEHKVNKLIDKASKDIREEHIKELGLDKPWYPFGKANIEISNGGKIKKWDAAEKKYKDIPAEETRKFLEANPKIMEEILKKELDKIKVSDLNWGDMSLKGKGIIWEALKNSIFSKGHLKIIGVSSAYSLLEVLTSKEENRGELFKQGLMAFLIGYVPLGFVGILVVSGRTFKYAGGKLVDVTSKYLGPPTKHVLGNKWKYITGAALTATGIKLYTAKGDENN